MNRYSSALTLVSAVVGLTSGSAIAHLATSPALASSITFSLGKGEHPSQQPIRLAQFNPTDRGAPLTADGGAVRFSPPDRGAPEGASSGATRNSCVTLTPLMPEDGNGAFYGLTSSGQPTFYWYALRAESSEAQHATFYLYEYSPTSVNTNPVYQRQFDLSRDTRSIVKFSLNQPSDPIPLAAGDSSNPDQPFELRPGQQYEWFVEIECKPDSDDPTTLAFTQGWLERSETLHPVLDPTPTNDLAAYYGETGLWFEYLNTLISANANNWGYILDGFTETIKDKDMNFTDITVDPVDNDQAVQILEISR